MTTTPSPERALVVSDDDSLVAVVTGVLGEQDVDVLTVTDVPSAERFVGSVDIAVVDVRLGDGAAMALCERIRATPEVRWMPVIHLGDGRTAIADRTDGLLRGADSHLALPLDEGELSATVVALSRRTGARQRSARTAERLRSLNSATADVHAASDHRRVVEAVVEGASAVAGAPALVFTREPERATRWRRVRGEVVADAVSGAAFESAVEPARAGHSTFELLDPTLVDRPHLGVAFIDETGDPAGVIAVPADGEELRDEVLPLLAQLAITTSLAVANLRALDIEHRIAVTLQRSLLPHPAPTLPGLEVAFRYVAATRHAQVGGDFYEAFALDDRRMLVAIGDVVGHSLAAATVMAEVRHALRAYALVGWPLPDVLSMVEQLIRRFHRTMYTTVVVGIVDVAEQRFDFCSAGHLPLVRSTSTGTSLVESQGTLLGVGRSAPALESLPVSPGDRVLLVTDGLVERRDEPLDDGLGRLRDAVERHRRAPLADMLDAVLADVGPNAAQDDDIAVLAFEIGAAVGSDEAGHTRDRTEQRWVDTSRPPTPGGSPVTPLLIQHVDLPRDDTAPARARHALQQALVGLPQPVVEDAMLAVSEVVTNAVLHAGGAHRLTYRIDRHAHCLRVEVHDTDRRRPRRRLADHGSPGGRGMPILDALCREHGSRETRDGKVVWLEIDLEEDWSGFSGGGAR